MENRHGKGFPGVGICQEFEIKMYFNLLILLGFAKKTGGNAGILRSGHEK